MDNNTSKVVHFGRLKRAFVNSRDHKLFESELEFTSSSVEKIIVRVHFGLPAMCKIGRRNNKCR